MIRAGLIITLCFCFSLFFADESPLADEDDLARAAYYQDILIHPMSLNDTEIRYLERLPGWSHESAVRADEYRKNKPFETLSDLTNIGFTEADIFSFQDYIRIVPPKVKPLEIHTRISLVQDGDFTLSNQAVSRSDRQSDLQGLILAESKDYEIYAGLRKETNALYPNAMSAPWNVFRIYGILNLSAFTIAAGHYTLDYGQGLLFGPSMILPASSLSDFPVRHKSHGLTGYKSLTEDPDQDKSREYLSGAAVSWEDFGFRLTGFGSYFPTDLKNKKLDRTDFGGNIRFPVPLAESSGGITVLSSKVSNSANSIRTSGYYQSRFWDALSLAGEAAFSGDIAWSQGFSWEWDSFKASVLGYSAGTNFDSPYGSPFLHGSDGTHGAFAGASFDNSFFYFQASGDWYGKITNNLDNDAYEAKTGLRIRPDWFWLRKINTEAKARYTENTDGDSLRNTESLMLEFPWIGMELGFRFQNLLQYTRKEMGNMTALRLKIQPVDWLTFAGKWNSYSAASYYSALFGVEEMLYPGDFNLTPYYGIGNEYSFIGRIELPFGVKISGKWSRDIRYIGNGTRRQSDTLGFAAEGSW